MTLSGEKGNDVVLKNAAVDGFAGKVIRENKKIVLFGAGTLLKSWIPYLLDTYGLTERVLFAVDNDSAKWGTKVRICGREVEIRSPQALCREDAAETVILIVSSYFASMIRQLDEMEELAQTECYVAPVMHITDNEAESREAGAEIRKWQSQKQQIPKVIHYCWFGKKEMPERNRQYMESWKTYCPGYEIIRWDESTYDISKNLYMKQAYDMGKYGYVPDYARIDILYHYGGLYFDTDVELLRSPEELLYLEAFTGFEEYPTINFGGGSGCRKGFPLLGAILDFREDICFIKPDGTVNRDTCGYYESVPLVGEGLRLDGSLQNVKGLTVFPAEYFHPRSSVTGLTKVTERTYSIHQFDWSWNSSVQMGEKLETHRIYEQILKRMQENDVSGRP